jgi:hypothetical protein
MAVLLWVGDRHCHQPNDRAGYLSGHAVSKKRGIGPAQTPPKEQRKPWCHICGGDLNMEAQARAAEIGHDHYDTDPAMQLAWIRMIAAVCTVCIVKAMAEQQAGVAA